MKLLRNRALALLLAAMLPLSLTACASGSPAATAASMPDRPFVFGTITLLTFLMRLPLASTRTSSGRQPKTSRARAAPYAMAIGSVQPIAGISSSRRICKNVSFQIGDNSMLAPPFPYFAAPRVS